MASRRLVIAHAIAAIATQLERDLLPFIFNALPISAQHLSAQRPVEDRRTKIYDLIGLQ
jgi:hypothetical protein